MCARVSVLRLHELRLLGDWPSFGEVACRRKIEASPARRATTGTEQTNWRSSQGGKWRFISLAAPYIISFVYDACREIE